MNEKQEWDYVNKMMEKYAKLEKADMDEVPENLEDEFDDDGINDTAAGEIELGDGKDEPVERALAAFKHDLAFANHPKVIGRYEIADDDWEAAAKAQKQERERVRGIRDVGLAEARQATAERLNAEAAKDAAEKQEVEKIAKEKREAAKAARAAKKAGKGKET